MTYELAKRLKDAGFPQDPLGPFILPNGNILNVSIDNPNNITGITYEDGVTIPTLDELIAACGDRYFGLERSISGKWFASLGIGTKYIQVEGETPEEALANLWLALNKK